MADEAVYPRWFYSPQVPAGRVFNDQAALDAASAEGPWFTTPTEAAEAATTAPAIPAPAPEDEGEHPTRRSHR